MLVTALALAPSVPVALEAYTMIRQPRMEIMHELVATTQKNLHLDGDEELRRRDEAMKALKEQRLLLVDGDAAAETNGRRETIIKHPDRWADAECQNFMYGVDVMKLCVERWEELRAQAEENLRPQMQPDVVEQRASLGGLDGVQEKRADEEEEPEAARKRPEASVARSSKKRDRSPDDDDDAATPRSSSAPAPARKRRWTTRRRSGERRKVDDVDDGVASTTALEHGAPDARGCDALSELRSSGHGPVVQGVGAAGER